MPYPVVREDAAKSWFKKWQDACVEAGARVAPIELPKLEFRPFGDDFDWDNEIASVVHRLQTLLTDEGEKAFEAKGTVLVHEALPDHEALRDPEFWYWIACSVGRELIEARYPFKSKDQDNHDPDNEAQQEARNYLPGRNNFVGQNAKEVLFFRLWIRAEMGRLVEVSETVAESYEYARAGSVEFWRSHLLRVLYAQHRPFLRAFLDFQFPVPDRNKPKLTIPEIRQLAKDLAKACANVSVEVLDQDQSKVFVERVWARTSATKAWVKG